MLGINSVIVIDKILNSRYEGGFDNTVDSLVRPLDWDDRVSGLETFVTDAGQEIKLNSSGQQPTPQKGWKLVLTGGNSQSGYTWTLYGIAKN